MKVFSVVGNRPQFIKAAPTSVALRERGIDEVVLHTGQHYDSQLSQVFFEELGLEEPRYALDLRTADAAEMRAAIAGPLAQEEPDWVLVYGDTNSTLAGALAADEAGMPLAHVEAGLRSGDLSMPEERNRIETDRIARLLFCPDERSAEMLAAEGVRGRAEVVGDVMADATRVFAPIAQRRAAVGVPEQYAVLTIHREANTEPEALRRIVQALNETGWTFVFPVHPRTRNVLDAHGIELGPQLHAIEPVGYLEMLALRLRRDPGRHRLGRPAEGGVLAAHPLHHAQTLDRMGGHRAGRGEHPGRSGGPHPARVRARAGTLPSRRAAPLRRRPCRGQDRGRPLYA